MGKVIRSTTSSTRTITKKTGCKKKKIKVHKRPDILNDYLRSLSTNFGPTTKTTKRKRQESDASEEAKKAKFVEEKGDIPKRFKQKGSVTVDTKFVYKSTTLQSDDEIRDLFFIDESKSSSEHTIYTDWWFHILDELSLEGLDGITLEAYWLRLKNISSHIVLLDGKEKLIWDFLRGISGIEYYILPNSREKLIIYDRNSFVCPDTGIVLEPLVDCDDIYPYSVINKDGIRGSCSTFDTRQECSEMVKQLNLIDVSRNYGDKLVMVASQAMRENSIICEISNPNIELSDNEYGLLERVGRSRKLGELTQGKVSVLNIIKDSRSIFHIRKSLEKKKLLKKQFFILRSITTSQNKTGKLLHLPRFHRIQKSKTLLLIEEIVELLRQKKGCSLEFGEFRKYFPRSTGVHKIMKMPEFNKYVKTNIFQPYRYLYPNAKPSEWKYKNRDKEKQLRIFQLIDPTINVSACWDTQDLDQNSDDECLDDESPGNKMICSEFLKEVFLNIFNRGKDGVTLQELEKNIELDYYTMRIAIRKLQAKNVIDSVRSEHGKQRHIYYFARCFHSKNIEMPVPKELKIPQTILQKILQPQKAAKTSCLIKSSNLSISGKRVKFSPVFPIFSCQTFARTLKQSNQEILMEMHTQKMINFSRKSFFAIASVLVNSKLYETAKVNRRKSWNLAKTSNIIYSYKNSDLAMKLVLLKLLIFEMKAIPSELLEGNASENKELENGRIDFETLMNERRSINYRISSAYNKDYLLGQAPLVLIEETTPENVDVTLILSTPPEQYVPDYTSYVTFDRNLTALSLSRTNIILELIKKNLVICDIFKLQKSVMEKEVETNVIKSGQGKIDKNTLNRILLKLSTEGYVKIFKLILRNDDKFKTTWILTHPSIEIENSLFRIIKEQAVIKFFLGIEKGNKLIFSSENLKLKTLPSPFDSHEIQESVERLKEIANTESGKSYKINRQFGKILGYQPKFVRLQLVHEMLYYVIYDYQMLHEMSHSDVEDILAHFKPEEYHEIPPIYNRNVGWKMFIPPLPTHRDWDCGWALLCDVLLAMPLSLWVKLFFISLDCPELKTFMEHPIRRHYLIKDIPIEFRHVIMFRRKYVFTAVELLEKLCFMGLVQLGPQSPNIKDQLFLYLNRRVTLLDTTTSSPSYHKVTPKQYDEIPFHFTSSNDVDDYWCQLWTISMNTPLGQRTIMDGKSVTIEGSTYKASLSKSLRAKTCNEAKNCDKGIVPGDRLGAGGLDSSMWSHIKRNWLWNTKSQKRPVPNKQVNSNMRDANIAGIKPISIKYRELINEDRKIFLPVEQKRSEYVVNSVKRNENKKIFHRKIKRPLPKLNKKQRFSLDAKDKSIIRRVGRIFRASWNRQEDKLLFLCKYACDFLSSSNQALISFSVIRDVMHALRPDTENKTSAACIRRYLKLRKIDPTMKRCKETACNLVNLIEISKYFSPIIFHLNRFPDRNPYSPQEIVTAYIYLMSYINRNIANIDLILQGRTVTLDYLGPNNIDTFSSILVNVERKRNAYMNPTTEEDVEKDVIRSVLLSSLSNSKSAQNTSYQLYKIYKKYPDFLIRSAVMNLKNKQVISINKRNRLSAKGIKSMPFQLSVFYNNMMKSTLSPLIIRTIYEKFIEMTGKLDKFCDMHLSKYVFDYGRFMARNELATVWSDTNYTFKIPDAAYILNPYVEDHSSFIVELATLYRNYLGKMKEKRDSQKLYNNPPYLPNSKLEIKRKYKEFEIIKSNVTRLLTSLPCLCNKKINESYTPFIETKDEKDLQNYLSIFLESLTGIALNLLSVEPDGVRFLQNLINKYHRSKLINSVSKQLEARVFKIGNVIREFLKSNQLTNIKECFENEYISSNKECENLLQVWLERTKINGQLVVSDGSMDTLRKPNVQFSFFKYMQPKPILESCAFADQFENIPTIDEIIKGMMAPDDPKFNRRIPYISDLASLLMKDKFNEFSADEKFVENLKKHFTTQYPLLDTFTVDRTNVLRNMPELTKLFNVKNKKLVMEKVNRNFLVREPNKSEIISNIRKHGGDTNDLRLCDEIITYVYNKGVLGVTGEILKAHFQSKTRQLNLVMHINNLVENFVFLRTGIAEILFVHSEFASSWLVQTFHLLPQENHLLETSEGKNLGSLKEIIESRIKSTRQVNVLLMPWILVDGTLNMGLFEKWLTLVLLHCLDFPKCPLMFIFEKFYHMKPVELYFLLEVLQDLNCLEIRTIEQAPVSLLSTRKQAEPHPASFLDSFKNMYIEVHTLSTSCLGFHLDRDNTEFC